MLTAQELRTKRQETKMTQAQLAKAIGVEETLIANYEKGDAPISAEHEAKLQSMWRTKPPAPSQAATLPATQPATLPMTQPGALPTAQSVKTPKAQAKPPVAKTPSV